jgi:hypothetical protein
MRSVTKTLTALVLVAAAASLIEAAPTGTLTPIKNLIATTGIYGSTAANGDLNISGTTHATKTTSDVTIQYDGGNTVIGNGNGGSAFTANNVTTSFTVPTLGPALTLALASLHFGDTLNQNEIVVTPGTSIDLMWLGSSRLKVNGSGAIIPLGLYGSEAANGSISIDGTTHATKATSTVNIQTSGGIISMGSDIRMGAAGDPLTSVRAKKKNNTDSRSSNTTVIADSELVIPIAASQVWNFEFHVYVNSSSATTPGWKGGLTFPTSPTDVRWSMDYIDYDAHTYTPKGKFTGDSTTTTCALSSITTGGEVIMRGQIRNGSNAGNITLMYAQAVSDVSSTLNQTRSWATATLVP